MHPYPTMHHFVTEMCTYVHISVAIWCIVGCLSDALWDLWDGSIACHIYILYIDKFELDLFITKAADALALDAQPSAGTALTIDQFSSKFQWLLLISNNNWWPSETDYIHRLVHDCSNSSALAMELLFCFFFCTKPLTWFHEIAVLMPKGHNASDINLVCTICPPVCFANLMDYVSSQAISYKYIFIFFFCKISMYCTP